jgi:hypothetical protein
LAGAFGVGYEKQKRYAAKTDNKAKRRKRQKVYALRQMLGDLPVL